EVGCFSAKGRKEERRRRKGPVFLEPPTCPPVAVHVPDTQDLVGAELQLRAANLVLLGSTKGTQQCQSLAVFCYSMRCSTRNVHHTLVSAQKAFIRLAHSRSHYSCSVTTGSGVFPRPLVSQKSIPIVVRQTPRTPTWNHMRMGTIELPTPRSFLGTDFSSAIIECRSSRRLLARYRPIPSSNGFAFALVV